MCATGNQVRKLVFANQIDTSQSDAVHVQEARNFVNACFNGVIGGRLTKTSHGFLGCFVRHHRHGIVFHTLYTVGPHNGAYWLAELQR